MLGIVAFFFMVLTISGVSSARLLGIGVVLVALIYAASFLVRYLSRRIERKAWEGWGGPSSTLDRAFKADSKLRAHATT